MKNPLRLSLALVAVVAACGTPQQQCINSATRDLATVDRLIAEAETNLARGFTYETREVVHHEWTRCDDWVPGTPPRMCLEPVFDTIKKPVAIDPAVEERKLATLKVRRKALEKQAQSAIAICKQKYPES